MGPAGSTADKGEATIADKSSGPARVGVLKKCVVHGAGNKKEHAVPTLKGEHDNNV